MRMLIVQSFCLFFGLFKERYTVLSEKYASNIKKFSVITNSRIINTADIFTSTNVKSSHVCASLCTMNSRCCAVDVETMAGKCSMHSSCCTNTMQMQSQFGTTVMLKDTAQDQRINDCSELDAGSQSGVYSVYPNCGNAIQVYCEMSVASGGWTVVQKRFNGLVDFNRGWNSYKYGFGDKNGEFWLGNDNLHILTSQKPNKIRFELKSANNDVAYAEYNSFYVDDEVKNYRLILTGYSGHSSAGDGMKDGMTGNTLSGMGFSTYDNDNDANLANCAFVKQAGWWFRDCTHANLNGVYNPGLLDHFSKMYWKPFKGFDGLKKSTIMIKPA